MESLSLGLMQSTSMGPTFRSSGKRPKTSQPLRRGWGHGAIIYRHGFCDGLKLKGAILLDASPIDLTELIEHNQRLNDERISED